MEKIFKDSEGIIVKATGGGAHKYKDLIKQKLGVK
jgi:pantothenate kinase